MEKLVDIVLRAVEASGLSDRRISLLTGRSPDLIRNVRRGASPLSDSVDDILKVLGLEIELAPSTSPPDIQGDEAEVPTVFNAKRPAEVRTYQTTSNEDWYDPTDSVDKAPLPIGLNDAVAFYIKMPDDCMNPFGAGTGEYCLVSPCAALALHDRVWLRTRSGHETVGWLVQIEQNGFHLGRWHANAEGPATLSILPVERSNTIEGGPIIATFAQRPDTKGKIKARAAWKPAPVLEVWAAAQFEPRVKEVIQQANHAIDILSAAVTYFRTLAWNFDVDPRLAEKVLTETFRHIRRELRNLSNPEA